MLSKILNFFKFNTKVSAYVSLHILNEDSAVYRIVLEGHDVMYITVRGQDAINNRMSERDVLVNIVNDFAISKGINEKDLNIVWEQL